MKKTCTKLIGICLLTIMHALSSFGQNWFPGSGNVGIGTNSPGVQLEVNGGGIRVSNPNVFPYGINIDVSYDNATPWAREFMLTHGKTKRMLVMGAYAKGNVLNYCYIGGNTPNDDSYSNPWMVFMPTGNIGIGTVNPGSYKLAVQGTVGANRIKVQQGTWADFVFHSDYELPSLQSVENFIRENKHLPGIPSEKEVKEEGVDLGEMNKKLLQKVEELTLYVIQLRKEMDEMKKRSESAK